MPSSNVKPIRDRFKSDFHPSDVIWAQYGADKILWPALKLTEKYIGFCNLLEKLPPDLTVVEYFGHGANNKLQVSSDQLYPWDAVDPETGLLKSREKPLKKKEQPSASKKRKHKAAVEQALQFRGDLKTVGVQTDEDLMLSLFGTLPSTQDTAYSSDSDSSASRRSREESIVVHVDPRTLKKKVERTPPVIHVGDVVEIEHREGARRMAFRVQHVSQQHGLHVRGVLESHDGSEYTLTASDMVMLPGNWRVPAIEYTWKSGKSRAAQEGGGDSSTKLQKADNETKKKADKETKKAAEKGTQKKAEAKRGSKPAKPKTRTAALKSKGEKTKKRSAKANDGASKRRKQ